jgi:uncharacterized repeat protein (TIGR01451 family)
MKAKRILFVLSIIFGLVLPICKQAAADVTSVTPLTWNVIGMDSNSPSTGPFRFPVGARVCSDAAGSVPVIFTWAAGGTESDDTNIYLRAGSLGTPGHPLNLTFSAPGCLDAYFEVEVNKTAVPAPYDKTRRYYITAGGVSTPEPRELYVEHLISQNRNGITDVKLNGTSVPSGGSMTLMVGNTYTIELDGFTATQGYNQLESFINFPNTIFQVLSVSTTYTADSNTINVPNPNSKLYANACIWDNDPGSPTYRSCVGGSDKAGGTVSVTYTVKIISGGGTSQTLGSLFYDFSGSSFHYNADYGLAYRIANIVSPSSVTISKTFTPKAMAPGDTSVMSFKLTNPTTETITGVNFTDTLLGGLKVASTPGVTYNGCGAGAFSPALVTDATSLSFSGGTIAPNSVCTITVNVTAPAGTYPNTTGHLFINTSVDTDNTGSDTLTASTYTQSCTTGVTLAEWTVPTTATQPPDSSSPVAGSPTNKAGNVGNPAAGGVGGTFDIDGTIMANAGVWEGSGFPTAAARDTGKYFQFTVDTTKYKDIVWSFDAAHKNNGPVSYGFYYTPNGGAETVLNSSVSIPTNLTWYSQSQAVGSGYLNAGNTVFRIYPYSAGNNGVDSKFVLDKIKITGTICTQPPPTITKSFSPLSKTIIKGATSTLTFTINNTSAGNQALTGVAFTDVLPAGLSITDSSSTKCTSGTLTTSAATRTIALTGGSLAAGGSCTFDVTVTGTTEGQYNNVSGFISSTESGISTIYATDSLAVIAPPSIAKSFNQASILVGGTSTLAFTITNPNQLTALNGIGFTDTLPAGLTATNGTTNSLCGSGSLVITGGNLLTFSGGSLSANSNCNFSVQVTGATIGTKNNITSAVTSTEGGPGNTASATLVVSNPVPLIGLNKEISTDNTNWFKFVGVPLPLPQNVYYRFTVSNEGETVLSTVSVTDPDVSMASCSPALPSSLAIGASAGCVVGPVSVASIPDPNPFANTATVTTSTYTPSTPVTSSAKYGTKSLTIAKSVTESYFTAAGNVLHYSYVVTNNGGYPLLGPVTVADDKSTNESCPSVTTAGDGDSFLDPGESITCTATYTVTSGDVTAGSVTNTASATAEGVTSNTDSKTVSIAAIHVVKSSTTTTITVAEQSVPYTFTVTGNVTLSGISVTDGQCDTPPAYLSGDTIISDGKLQVGETWIYTCSHTVSQAEIEAGGNLSNTVTADSNESGPDTDTLNILIKLNADLAITKTADNMAPDVDDDVIFTIMVKNNGPSDATGVKVKDILSSSLLWQSDDSGPSYDHATGIWDIGTLTVGSTATINITAKVTGAGRIINVASITASDVPDPDLSNNSSGLILNQGVDEADLAVVKEVDNSNPGGSGTIHFTLTVTNNGPKNATNVQVTDVLPSGLNYVEDDSGGSYDVGSRAWTWNVGSLDVGVSVTSHITVTVTDSNEIINTAKITASDQFDPDKTNNQSSVVINKDPSHTTVADLAVQKIVDLSSVDLNDTVVFTVIVRNNGPDDAHNVKIQDVQTAGLTNLSTNGCAEDTGGIPTCSLGTITAGSYAMFEITADVTDADIQTNTASVLSSDETDPNPDNDTDDATVSSTHADLLVTKSDGTTSVATGSSTTYTITVTNNGPSSVTGAILTDASATGLSKTAVACSGTPGQCVTAPSIAELEGSSFTLPELADGDTYQITVTADVTATGGSVKNDATIAPPAGTTNSGSSCVTGSGITRSFSSSDGVCTSSDTDTVYGHPTIAKAFGTSPITAGGTSTITFTLTNPNTVVMNDASFTDTLSNMAISGAQNAGGTCTGASTNSLANGDTSLSFSGITILASGSCTVTVLVTSSTVGTNPNTASGVTTTEVPTEGDASNTANLVVYGHPTIAKAFGTSPITAGGTSTITFTLTNPNTVAMNNASFTDTLSNMSISGAQNAGGTCTGASTNSLANGDTSLSFSGITILASGSCTVTVLVTSSTVGTNPNTTSGVTTTEVPTAGTASNTANLVVNSAHVFDPPSGRKTVNADGYPELEWRMVWINDSNVAAILVRVTDSIPVDTTYVPDSVQCVANGGSSTSLGSCIFDAVNNRIVWEGNIAPDPGATDEDTAVNEVVITYRTTMPETVRRVENQGCAIWDESGNESLDDEITNNQVAVCTDDPDTDPSGDPTVWENEEIPTMNQWGLMFFMLIAGLGGVYYLRRRRGTGN